MAPAARASQAGIEDSPSLTIVSEARCVENSIGIPINENREDRIRVACLKDKTVQFRCNPDGAHARIQAFRQWSEQLAEFKDRCSAIGGMFAFSDPSFKEPTHNSFCSTPEIQVGYDSFEDAHCNFISRCPAVQVTCVRTPEAAEAAQRKVALPGIPAPIDISK
jgi:hypothetical protein